MVGFPHYFPIIDKAEFFRYYRNLIRLKDDMPYSVFSCLCTSACVCGKKPKSDQYIYQTLSQIKKSSRKARRERKGRKTEKQCSDCNFQRVGGI